MNAEAGVPVGDTTLERLVVLENALRRLADGSWNLVAGGSRPGLGLTFQEYAAKALLAAPMKEPSPVAALVRAAQPFSDDAMCLDGDDCPHKVCVLNRALAPFVGEATQ